MALTAKELRIGNYLHDAKGKLAIVEGLSKDNIKAYSGMVTPLPLKPIPLTEEWLLKFGFEKINHIRNGEIWVHKLVKITWYPNGMTELRGSVGWVKVNHVHSLQNLYHALTGEELKTK